MEYVEDTYFSKKRKGGRDDDDDDSSDGEVEPSLSSIPQNDARIEPLIIQNDYEPSISARGVLAPHWIPHASPAGHHIRDFSHDISE